MKHYSGALNSLSLYLGENHDHLFLLPVKMALNFRNKLMAITLKACQLFFYIQCPYITQFLMGIKKSKSFFNGHEFLIVFSWPLLGVHSSIDTDVMLRKCGVPSGAIVNAHRTCIEK